MGRFTHFAFAFVVGVIGSTIEARSAEIEYTLEAYASHGAEPGPIVTDRKTYELPRSKVPWRVVSYDLQETARNGNEYTTYKLRFIPSSEHVERVELEVSADLNRPCQLRILGIEMGPRTWIGMRAQIKFEPWIDPELLVDSPESFKSHFTFITEDFSQNLAGFTETKNAVMTGLALLPDSTELSQENLSALRFLVTYGESFVGGYIRLLDESIQRFGHFDSRVVDRMHTTQTNLENLILEIWTDAADAAAASGTNPSEIFQDRFLQCSLENGGLRPCLAEFIRNAGSQ